MLLSCRFEAASFLEQSSRVLSEKGDQNASKLFAEEAANVYEKGISGLLKNTLILYFAYADFEEVSTLALICVRIYWSILADDQKLSVDIRLLKSLVFLKAETRMVESW